MEKVTIEIDALLASCLQRMLVDEVDNQREWIIDDKKYGHDHESTRLEIIEQCKDAMKQLERQGIEQHWKDGLIGEHH